MRAGEGHRGRLSVGWRVGEAANKFPEAAVTKCHNQLDLHSRDLSYTLLNVRKLKIQKAEDPFQDIDLVLI